MIKSRNFLKNNLILALVFILAAGSPVYGAVLTGKKLKLKKAKHRKILSSAYRHMYLKYGTVYVLKNPNKGVVDLLE
ncbi:hypothetical protein ACFLZ2_01645 [Candidatus Margulisiibacteriota bacterium]